MVIPHEGKVTVSLAGCQRPQSTTGGWNEACGNSNCLLFRQKWFTAALHPQDLSSAEAAAFTNHPAPLYQLFSPVLFPVTCSKVSGSLAQFTATLLPDCESNAQVRWEQAGKNYLARRQDIVFYIISNYQVTLFCFLMTTKYLPLHTRKMILNNKPTKWFSSGNFPFPSKTWWEYQDKNHER